MYIAETERMVLRELNLQDAASVVRIFSDPRSMEFAPMAVTSEISIAQDFIGWHRRNYKDFGYGSWAVILKDSQQFVGQAGLVPHHAGVEVFYSFIPEYWGRGLATEAAMACLRHGWEQLKLRRLISVLHPQNHRAIRVAEKIGMKPSGIIRMWNRENLLYESA